jgi:8-oxo-dGTP pyrophosphatase MutT (NUDIX family)
MTTQTSIAIPSATIMTLRERSGLEVLMVKRGAGATFGSAHVFPGGKLDEDDLGSHWLDIVDGADALDDLERGLRISAWREMYEETGLMPSVHTAIGKGASRDIPFRDLIRQSGIKLPLHHLQPFARWITPIAAAKRFDTYFYICALDSEDAQGDGFEIVDAEWIRPHEALDKHATGEWSLVFPTKCQLQLLSESNSIAEAFHAAINRKIVPVLPLHERMGDHIRITIPPEAGYSICEDRWPLS